MEDQKIKNRSKVRLLDDQKLDEKINSLMHLKYNVVAV